MWQSRVGSVSLGVIVTVVCQAFVPVSAQPGPTPIQPDASSGSAQAGTATIGPGRLVTPEDIRQNEIRFREEQLKAPLFTGTPGEEEMRAAQALMQGKDPRQMISEFTHQFGKPAGPPGLAIGTLNWIGDEALQRIFPNKLFYVLRFRQYPLAVNLPAPLRPNNIFVVDGNGNVEMITMTDQLEAMFRGTVHGTSTEPKATDVMLAWLRLSEELQQDGMYRFLPPTAEVAKGAELVATGRVAIEPQGGNLGQIEATIRFTNSGDVATIQQTADLRRGMRPICQSTKLLDDDPIVRKMAEQDLLIMGSNAKDYLDEQRAKASPELQAAIDRVWKRIVDEHR